MLNWKALKHEDLSEAFAIGRPFPNVVIDNACDPIALEAALQHWPRDGWKQFQKGKRAHNQPEQLPEPIAKLMYLGMNSQLILWLRALTGIDDLSGDPSLHGGGLHEVSSGGSLGMHVDFNRNGDLYRRVNAILYLNHNWRDEWGGALELWDRPQDPARKLVIPPKFNRLVIFEASEHSWHGHPKPLACPEWASRKSVAFYFYSATPHPSYHSDHSTVYSR